MRCCPVRNALVFFVIIYATMSIAWAADANFEKLFSSGKYKEAIDYAEEKVSVADRDAKIWAMLGIANEEQGLIEKALACYMVAIRLDQKNYEAHLGAARIYNKMGQAESALDMSKKAMEIKPTGEASWAFAQACIAQNRVSEAKAALEKVTEMDPSNIVAHRTLGNVLFKEKEYANAVKYLKKAYAAQPDGETAMDLALAFKTTGNLDTAAIFYKEASRGRKTPLPEATIELARIYFQKKKYAESVDEYSSVDRASLLTKDLFDYAESIDKSNGNREKMVEVYEAAIQKAGSGFSKEVLGAKEVVGRYMVGKKKYAEALDALDYVRKNSGGDSKANPEILFLIAEAYCGMNKASSAIPLLEVVISRDKKNVEAYARLAEVYTKEKMTEKAKAVHEKLLSLQPNNPDVFNSLGEYYLKAKNYGEALKNFQKSFTLESRVQSAVGMMTAAWESKQYDIARDAAESALHKDPNLLEPQIILAKIFFQEKNYDAAAQKYIDLLKNDGNNLEYLEQLALCYEKTGQKNKLAETDKKIVSIDKKNVAARLRYADFTKGSGDLTSAKEILDELLELQPRNTDVLKSLYDISVKTNQKKDAVRYLSSYLSINSDDAKLHKELGDLLYETDDKDGALASYRTALKKDASIKGLYKRYAELVMSRKSSSNNEQQEVLSVLNAAIKAGEADGEIFATLGAIYRNQGDFVKAIDMYQKALQKDPKDIESLAALAFCQEKAGKISDAIISYEQAAVLNTANTDAYKSLGNLYLKTGKKELAVNAFKKYVEKTPEDGIAVIIGDFELGRKKYSDAIGYYSMVKGSDAGNIKVIENFSEAAYMNGDMKRAEELLKMLTVKAPKNPEPFLKLFEIQIKKGDKKEAVGYLERYSALKPSDAANLQKLGDLQYELKNEEKAIDAYRALIKANPNAKGFYRKYLELVTSKGTPQEKNEALKNAVAFGEADAAAYEQLGSVYRAEKNYAKALHYFEKASSLDPKSISALRSVAECQEKTGATTAAILTYEQVAALDPKADKEYKSLGDLYSSQKKMDNAVGYYKKYLARVKDDSLALFIADYEFGKKNNAEAVKYYDMVSGKRAEAPAYLRNYGKASLDADNIDKALEVYKRLLVATPQDADVFKTMFELLFKKNNKDEALVYLKKYVVLKPADAQAQKTIGDMLYARDDKTGAVAAYKAALKADPGIRGFHKNYAEMVIEQGSETDIAEALSVAVASGEADGGMYKRLGSIYITQKKYNQAIPLFEKASQKDLKDVSLLAALADAQAKSGNSAAAILTYEQVIALDTKAVDEYKALGDLYKSQKRIDNAMKNYRKYLEKKSDSKVSLEVARHLYENKEYAESVNYFNMVSGAEASSSEVVKVHAEAALLSKNNSKAFELYKKVAAFEPNNADALKKLYELSVSSGAVDDVLYYLKKYVVLKPEDAEAQKMLGDILYDKKDSGGALAAYRAAYKTNPKIKGIYKKFALLLYKSGTDPEIIAVLSSAISVGEADLEMYIRLGEAFLKVKDYTKAISSFEKASQLDPKNTTVLANLAAAHVASGNISAAILTYEQVVAMNPEAVKEYKELGDLYLKQKKNDQALNNYEKYLDKNQDNNIALLVGKELYNQKKYKESIKYLGMVTGSASSDPKHLMLYGNASIAANDDFKAFQIFRQLANLTPKDPVVFENLSKLAAKAGTKDDILKYLKTYTALKPDDAQAQKRLGDLYYERKDETGALGAYRLAFKADSTLKGFYKNYAELVMKHGSEGEKLIVLDKTVTSGEADARMFQVIGEIHEKNNRFDKAIVAFDKASRLEPKNDKLLSALAESQKKKGDVSQAIMTYEQVVALNPRAENELKELGELYMKQGRDSIAVVNYKKYLEKKPSDGDVAFIVGKASLKAKKYSEAVKYFDMVRGTKDNDADFIRMYGDASYETKDYPKALMQYNRLAKLTPKDPLLYKRLYEINLQSSAKSEALLNLKKYAAFMPNDAEAQKDLGTMLYEQGDKINALSAYRKALAANPKIKGIYKNYVTLVIAYGKLNEKVNALNSAIEAGEADAFIYKTAGETYLGSKNFKKAIEMYTEAVKLDQKDFTLYAALSECLLNVGDISSAAINLEKALKINPTANKEYKTLGDLYMKQKKSDDAIMAYSTYLSKNPSDEGVAKTVAEYFYRNRKYKDAYNYFSMVKNDNSTGFLIQYGISALNAQDYPGAILILEKVRSSKEKIENRDVAYKSLAEAYELHKKPEKAVDVLYDYIKLPGVKDPDAAFRIAAVYEAIDINKAVQMYKDNTIAYPKDYRNFMKLGFYYSKVKGSEKGALAYFEKTVSIIDTVSDVWLELGTLYGKMGRLQDMLRVYRKYIEVEPNNTVVQARIGEELLSKNMVEDAMVFLEMANAQEEENPKYMTLLARGYLMTDRQKEGVRLIEKVIKISKGNIDDDLRLILIDVYIETRDYKRAIDELKAIMQTNNSPKVLEKYAKALLASGKTSDALKVAEKIKEKNPENIEVHMMIGEIKVLQKKYNDAIETYKEILYMDQNYAPALRERANVYLLQGKHQWAQTFYDRALKVDPNDALIYLGLARLAKDKKDFATYSEMLDKARKLAPQNREIQMEMRNTR